jgi:hypothetical protein
MRVDMLTLYAFTDKVHAQQRELWRGFLALVMPVLLEFDSSEFERLLESAHCRSIETMLKAVDEPHSVEQLIWSLSATFSELLGLEPELGLSAFLDVNLPTRAHSIRLGVSTSKDHAIVGRWLRSFRQIQQRPEFLEMTSEWKRAFDAFFEDGEIEDNAPEEESGDGLVGSDGTSRSA